MRRWPVAAALIAVTLFLVVATQTRQGGWNDASRLAMVEAIAEHGHLWVDGTQMSRYTGDVARIDGKFYSDKPPALAFAAVPVCGSRSSVNRPPTGFLFEVARAGGGLTHRYGGGVQSTQQGKVLV